MQTATLSAPDAALTDPAAAKASDAGGRGGSPGDAALFHALSDGQTGTVPLGDLPAATDGQPGAQDGELAMNDADRDASGELRSKRRATSVAEVPRTADTTPAFQAPGDASPAYADEAVPVLTTTHTLASAVPAVPSSTVGQKEIGPLSAVIASPAASATRGVVPGVDAGVAVGRAEASAGTPAPAAVPTSAEGSATSAPILEPRVTAAKPTLVETTSTAANAPAATVATTPPAPTVIGTPALVSSSEALRTGTSALIATTEPAAQVADAIRLRANERSVTVRLDPPELGGVRIDFSFDRGAVTAVVAADQASTGDLLRRHSDWLHQAMAEAGIEDARITWSDANDAEQEADWQHLQIGQAQTANPGALPQRQDQRLASSGGIDLRL